MGAQVSRVDGPLKVMGAARFAAEVPLERLTYAALVPSTIARGRIAAIDTAAAVAALGVVLVMTHENAPRMKAPLTVSEGSRQGRGRQVERAVMQDDRVHWNGQPVAVVLAETQEQADHAATRIRGRLRRRARQPRFRRR